MAAILVLDDDLGFAVWLARLLSDAGYTAAPASRIEEAEVIIGWLLDIRLVIANFNLPGCQGVLDTLTHRGDLFRRIAIGAGTIQRPEGAVAPQPERYLKAVRQAIGDPPLPLSKSGPSPRTQSPSDFPRS